MIYALKTRMHIFKLHADYLYQRKQPVQHRTVVSPRNRICFVIISEISHAEIGNNGRFHRCEAIIWKFKVPQMAVEVP